MVLTMSKHSELFIKTVLSIYDIWNLRFFRYFVPPFCVSQKLKPIHVAYLGYIPVFYPICSMFLIWVCIELHGQNYRLVVCLWRTFHKYIVCLRRGWNTKSDIINVFASFFQHNHGSDTSPNQIPAN